MGGGHRIRGSRIRRLCLRTDEFGIRDGNECTTSAVESSDPGGALESIEEDGYPPVLADMCDGLYACEWNYGMLAEQTTYTYHCL